MLLEEKHLSPFQALESKIVTKKAEAGIIGLGYVGLPLAVELGAAGFHVTGIDTDQRKAESLTQGKSYVKDVASDRVAALNAAGLFKATTDFSAIRYLDTISVCVPTPLRKTKDPDMSYIVAAFEEIARYVHPGMLIILESTTYPGTTSELLLPMLSESGLKVGEDFFLCFSPERVDPGNAVHVTRNIPKVIGGVTPKCTELGARFYSQAVDRVVPVSSTGVAEMVKLLENTFRMINIGLVNELAIMCDRMGFNVWEVIDAAATKPFGFMPFYPGPGLGGHCIPIDPYYLSWKSRQAGIEARFIELAGYINGGMPHFVVDKVQDSLNAKEKPVKGSRIHVLGVAYKRDIDDLRESPALDVIHLLSQKGGMVTYSDPYVPELDFEDGRKMRSEDPISALSRSDCGVIVTDHSCFDYAAILAAAPLIVDTRNAMKGMHSDKIVRL
ncbi:MAG: nucleotide sugar dehydrogenase [Bryobacterales bacterium]|nr:nucleotide sugar dehydrogenase [Bryobacterales bacterium]